jgi:hypothetical protein
MQHVQLDTPLSLEDWQSFVHAWESATEFHDYEFAFEGIAPLTITDELKQILEDFGARGRQAVFAVRYATIEAFWLDPLHNYVAIVCTKASGDAEDCVLTMSISPSTARGGAGCSDRFFGSISGKICHWV